jgi:hypothetical protein
LKSYIINIEIFKEDTFTQDQLISCFTYEWCGDLGLYHSFLEEIQKKFRASELEYKNLGIDVDSEEEVTWKIYIEVLFKVLWKESFYEGRYSLSEYSDFVGVLKEGMLYWESLRDGNVGFLDYESMRLDSINNEKLYHEVWFITMNHLKTINEIYKNLWKQEKLLIIIREYLN